VEQSKWEEKSLNSWEVLTHTITITPESNAPFMAILNHNNSVTEHEKTKRISTFSQNIKDYYFQIQTHTQKKMFPSIQNSK